MRVDEYLREKNKIVEELTGVILIPEEQIVDIPDFLKYLAYVPCDGLSVSSCPYCLEYFNCSNCPMYVAGNSCLRTHYHTVANYINTSTYYKAESLWKDAKCKKTDAYFEASAKLERLVIKFNKELGENNE